MTTRARTTERVVLITGGCRGLGRSAALALAARGDHAIITYRTGEAEALEVVKEVEAAGAKAVALPLDVTAFRTFPAFLNSVRSVLADHWNRQRIDALINSAGTAGDRPFGSLDQAEIERLVAVHFTGVVLLTQQLAPLIADGGRVLNVSSGLTRFVISPSHAIYAAMKAAIETWTVYLAQELGSHGIAVNAIAPGATATDFADGRVRDNPDIQAAIALTVALGRVGQPEDVGEAIAALLDPGMGWVTGQRIEASGGQRL
jgi:NAD(P)-dependent dehydrogenase (short-subunit alcohol dehydrogenase family)